MAKKNSSVVLVLIVVAVVLTALAFYFTHQMQDESLSTETANVSSEEVVTVDESDDITVVNIDVDAALKDRILGNPDAPVKISEHASFTCGHCGQFHLKTFKSFKEAWIDTGKAYLVFSDFPLNAPALHASMVARCLPEDQYFDFVSMLFNTQSEWAYDVGYMNYLKTKAAEKGLNDEQFKACLNSKELQEGILARVRSAQSQWNIASTPSFVVNNEVLIEGALPFAEFDAAIKNAVDPKPPEEAPAEGAPPPAAEENSQ